MVPISVRQLLAALELTERTNETNYAHLLKFTTLSFYFVLLWGNVPFVLVENVVRRTAA